MAGQDQLVGASTVGGRGLLSSKDGVSPGPGGGGRSWALLEAVISNLPAGICVWRGPELVYEMVNTAYQAFAPGKEFVGRTYAEVWPEATEPYTSIIRKVMETGEPHSVENARASIRREPGGPLEEGYWRIDYTALPPDGSGRAGVLCMATETTEQRRAEASEERLRTLLDNNPSLVFMKDEAGRYVYLNEAYEKQFVHSKDWQGKTDFDFWPKESAELFRKDDAEVLRSGQMKQFLEDSRDLTGKRYCWLCYKFPFTASDGRRYVGGVGIDTTGQLEAEEKLKASEEQFRRAIEDAPIPVIMHAEDGQVLQISHTWTELTGYTLQEMPTLDAWLTRAYGEGADEVRKYVRGLFHDGQQGRIGLEFPIRTRSGEIRHWSFSASSPGMLRDGRRFVVGMAVDITERQRAEEELRESEERFRRYFELGLIGMAITSPTKGWVEVNAEVCAILGYDRSELVRKTWAELTHPDDLAADVAQFNRILAGEIDGYTLEKRFLRKDGRVVYTTLSVRCLRRADHSVNYFVVLLQDITERKRAEAALRETNERLTKVLAVDAVGVMFWDLTTGCLVDANDTFLKLLGYSRSDLDARDLTWQKFTPPEYHEVSRAEIKKFQATGRVGPYEKEYFHKDGTRQWLLFSGSSLGGNMCVEFCVDIADRKKAEEALRKSEERQGYLLQLADALRPLRDPVEVQERAARVLAEHLGAERALYFEVRGSDYVVERDYAKGVAPLRGMFSIAAFGPKLWEAYQAGRTVVVKDVQMDPSLSAEERPAYAAIQIGAHVGVPLVKGGRLVAGLAVHAKERREWTAEEVKLIEETAERTWASVARARAEEAVREREAQLQAVLKSMTEGVVISDLGGNLIAFNDTALKLHRFKDADDWRRNLQDFPHIFELHDMDGRSLPVEEWPLSLVLRGGTLTHREVKVKRKDLGYMGVWRYQGAPVRDASGNISLAVITVEDITTRKRAEEALRRSETRLAQAVEVGRLGIFEHDHARGVIESSQEMREIFGFDEGEELTLAKMVERMAPEDRERVSAGIRRGHDPNGTGRHEVEHRIEVPGRGRRSVSVRAQTFFEGEGSGRRAVRTVGAVQDITERKAFEGELQRLVDERTAKLHELVGELEHFSYTITHDLKSPLRAMKGFAELAGELCEGGEAKVFLGRISAAADRMDRLIADALNYSRSVRQELPLEDVDAGAVLRGMLDSYPEFQPAKAQITVEGALPVVLANEAGLTQCFSNLLGNAVKFVKPGERPDIRVWAEDLAVSHHSGWVRIWVEDKGIGISRAMLPRVFEMFSRGSKDYEGTGIGLALVRKVVQRMGGKVGVESEEGKGSRFWIELKSGETRPTFAETTSRQGAAFGAAAAGQGTVLYVEDEESDAMFMERAFADKGMPGKLRVAVTGRAAIDYLSGSGEFGDREKYPVPALVLLDLNLPQVSGFGVLEWIRNNPDYARMPVVVFSSSTRQDDRVRARELGANDFVAKPSSGLKFGEVLEGLRRKWHI